MITYLEAIRLLAASLPFEMAIDGSVIRQDDDTWYFYVNTYDYLVKADFWRNEVSNLVHTVAKDGGALGSVPFTALPEGIRTRSVLTPTHPRGTQ